MSYCTMTKTQQDTYFLDSGCPCCGSSHLLVEHWRENLLTRKRKVFCETCEREYDEVHYKDVGQRFLRQMQP